MNLAPKLVLVLVLALAACAPPPLTPRRPTPGARPAEPSPIPEVEGPSGAAERLAVVMTLHSEGDAEALLTKLEAAPDLKVTLIFPPDYFDTNNRGMLSQRFADLQNNRQIEVALALDNEPNLPLLADLGIAGEKVQTWSFNFAWPEDAAAQTARGSGRYRKRWGQLPSGFAPPYGAVSEEVMQVLRRFRLSWVLARPDASWGVKFFGGTALVVPPEMPIDGEALAATAARDAARAALSRPFSYVDAGRFPTPDFETQFIAELEAGRTTAAAPLSTMQDFVAGLRDEYQLPEGVDPFLNDYSAWVRSPLQKRAWQALAEARKVIENYKNSGRANLNRLDAAVEEMCVAESGPFLLSLGDSDEPSTFGQRNFLATLANVYRLAGVPVPSNLGNWFADRSLHRPATRGTDNDRPFFVEGAQSLTWNDPKGDDNGPGDWIYPAGRYPKGSFDLRDVTVSWTDNDVEFTAAVADMPAAGSTAIWPLVDIYIDVNRLSEAGSTAVLDKRGLAVVERDAAWEYAVVLTPKLAALYQGLPGGEQRLLLSKPAESSGNGFSAAFPRRILRGQPRRWRITAAAGGAEASQRDEPPTPIAVLSQPTQKAFGGAPGPRVPPRYIDLLAASTDLQATRLRAYPAGAVILPYVEGE